MKIRGTDFVLYPVRHLAAAAAFYRHALGLKLQVFNEQSGWAEFDCGNVTLALRTGEVPPPGGQGARLALAVSDLDAAHAELREWGARIVNPPQEHGICRHFEVLDPDGNIVLLHQRADGTCGQTVSRKARRSKVRRGTLHA
jgi:predicted enzyme related to lactoylglutathione lyase